MDTEILDGRAAAHDVVPIDLVIVICTFRREKLLALALESIRAQTIPVGARLSVVVADNSDDGSAAVEAPAATPSPLPVPSTQKNPFVPVS